MTVLILYATTEGQTRKIARRAATHLIAEGHSVELLPVGEAGDLSLDGFEKVLLLASVHAGHYQPAFIAYAKAHRDQLARRSTAFLSVSLSAASAEPEDREGLDDVIRRMITETGWAPERIEHVAGAFRWSEYDLLRNWAMRWIASQRDPSVRAGQDKEYTDWAALDRFLDAWVGEAVSVPSA
ncbi:flavodoxin domain-containing protein [Rubellimicrobium arenae]|uniref:flavodoxin domain-containing protein n=1 Tax=Rubellimicrobium arenae TaxID=2817372 RepID=UPI001B3159AE|nr:flavodoxin domain-containing protein [Rubellimicrobium arenae]